MNLTEGNFELFAAKYYNNPSCLDTEEFFEDLHLFKYLKRLFNRYKDSGELRERLILNHIIIIYNLFGNEAATKMLFLKMEDHWSSLKSFLEYLNLMPSVIYDVDSRHIITENIPRDYKVWKILKEI